MSRGLALSPQEAVARALILERTRSRAHRSPVRRHVRVALALRGLAERLDPGPDHADAPSAAARPARTGGTRTLAC
jgi:hypothetical protein